MIRPARIFVALLCLVLMSGGVAAADPPAVDRLVRLAKLWGTVRYLHPWLAYRDLDWDAALLAAIPEVRAASDPQGYVAAVEKMLAALGDPATHVLTEKVAGAAEPLAGELPPLSRFVGDEVLVIDLRPYSDWGRLTQLFQRLPALQAELPKAKAVVIDLRGKPNEQQISVDYSFALEQIAPFLVRRQLAAPTQRVLFHSGYRPQTRSTSGGYYSAFLNFFAESYSPKAGPNLSKVAFLVTPRTNLPPVALALQAAGDGAVVSEGPITEESALFQSTVDLGEGFEAVVRTSEIVPLPGWEGVHADVEVAPGGDGDAAFEAALQWIASSPSGTPTEATAASLPGAVWRPDKTYAESAEPGPELRLLAVIRLWTVIHYFYPYKHLIGDWDAVLPEFLARMETAATGDQYALTIAEMAARVADGHTGVFGHPALTRLFGEAGLPVTLRPIEGRFVVTYVQQPEGDEKLPLEVGDVVTAVDGEPVSVRVEALRPMIAASTEAAFQAHLGYLLLTGTDGSIASLTVVGRDGAAREVTATRSKRTRWVQPPPSGETVRILADNVGYVDLVRLTVDEVDGMFEKLKDTRAIVFDLRGYPKGTAWSIAPRINTTGARFGATFRRSQISAVSGEEGEAGFYFSQPLPVSDQPKYTGKTVMLLDDRAISQSEHTGLFFEAANGTTFIGTPTAGANGDVTTLSLPGGITMSFTGHDVRHADGRQLQRVGLVPHVEVAPTIQGIRDGRDEVLERALAFLEEGPPAV